MLDRAGDLGIGCRLAALARDISEDAAAGRCYLPDDWLSEMDIPPGEHMKPPYRKRLAVLAERLADRAETFIASAGQGVADLPFRPAWVALTVAAVHRDILDDVVARGEHGWDHRIASSRIDLIDKAMTSGFRAMLRRRLIPGEPVAPPWRDARAWPAGPHSRGSSPAAQGAADGQPRSASDAPDPAGDAGPACRLRQPVTRGPGAR
jgi:phytoene synthase